MPFISVWALAILGWNSWFNSWNLSSCCALRRAAVLVMMSLLALALPDIELTVRNSTPHTARATPHSPHQRRHVPRIKSSHSYKTAPKLNHLVVVLLIILIIMLICIRAGGCDAGFFRRRARYFRAELSGPMVGAAAVSDTGDSIRAGARRPVLPRYRKTANPTARTARR